MRIGVAGADGRMGRLVCAAAGDELAGRVTRADGADGILRLARAVDVVVDFCSAGATAGFAAVLADAGTAWVLGTTGLDAAAERAVIAAATRIGVVQAANFSPGLTLLLMIASRLGAALPAAEYDAEILERHHAGKRDAPSGTAIALGRAVARGRGTEFDAAVDRAGVRPPGSVGFASLRSADTVGEHTLLFAGASEEITLGHRALDRRVFADGAVRAARWVAGRAPGRYTMEDVIWGAG